MFKPNATNVYALRDALAGLAGDKGAHVADVAARIADAVAAVVIHGNKMPLQGAAIGLAELKGKAKAVRAVKAGFSAAVGAVPFVAVGADGVVADSRAKKRGTAEDAAALAEAAADAFTLTFGAIWHAAPTAGKASAKADPVAQWAGADDAMLRDVAKMHTVDARRIVAALAAALASIDAKAKVDAKADRAAKVAAAAADVSAAVVVAKARGKVAAPMADAA